MKEQDKVMEILGHRPTDRVMKIIDDLEGLVREYCDAHPDATEDHAWNLVKTMIEQELHQHDQHDAEGKLTITSRPIPKGQHEFWEGDPVMAYICAGEEYSRFYVANADEGLRACFGHILELVEVEEEQLHFFDMTSKKPVYITIRKEDGDMYKGTEAERYVVLPAELPDTILRM